MYLFIYSPFHKTLPKSSLQMQWILVSFNEMGVIRGISGEGLNTFCLNKGHLFHITSKINNFFFNGIQF